MYDKGGLMFKNDTVTPVVPDTDTDVGIEPVVDPEYDPNLSPERLCPDQQTRTVRRIIRVLP